MFEPTKLTSAQVERCINIISSNAFYLMVTDAILKKQVLSVVRMGDGEKLLMDLCEGLDLGPAYRDITDPTWMTNLGCLGIQPELLYKRLNWAANECTWFAPSVSGIIRPEFSLYDRFDKRDRYVDNFFVNQWDDEMKINLYKAAGKVLFIHRNPLSFEALKVRCAKINVEATYIKLENWQQTDDVIAKAQADEAPLVLFSAGPAGKYIGHHIARWSKIPKVALDLGNSSDQWLLYSLHDK
jgi:hypothetical protein